MASSVHQQPVADLISDACASAVADVLVIWKDTGCSWPVVDGLARGGLSCTLSFLCEAMAQVSKSWH